MPDLKQITLPSGSVYNLVDQGARDLIDAMSKSSSWLGITTTELTDGATTNPITINNKSVTATEGSMVAYGAKEFIFNGTVWQELGDLTLLGELAYKNKATGSHTPYGDVSKPTFTGTKGNVTTTVKPEGEVSAPEITVTSNTTNVNSIENVGALPNLTFTVENENLRIGWDAGSLPTKGADQTVITGIESAVASKPTFIGTSKEYISEDYTPIGDVSKPTFTGTPATIEVS